MLERISEGVIALALPLAEGRSRDILDLVEQTGIMGVDALDPPPSGDCDLATTKLDWGARLLVKGNIKSFKLLECEIEVDLHAGVVRPLLIGKLGAGYILSTAYSVAPHVEPRKLEML